MEKARQLKTGQEIWIIVPSKNGKVVKGIVKKASSRGIQVEYQRNLFCTVLFPREAEITKQEAKLHALDKSIRIARQNIEAIDRNLERLDLEIEKQRKYLRNKKNKTKSLLQQLLKELSLNQGTA